MRMAEEWLKTWICLSCLFAWTTLAARPRFDVSTDMGMVLVPADAEVDSVIFRLRATDQDADFPLIFEIIATTSAIVRTENLPCTLYNKVCQANVILTRRLVPGRLHDFVVRVRDSKGDVNSMQATISVTNSTTPRDKIFPHLPSLIMVPEDTKPEKELDYILVESNPWSGKPVYIELWQPKELFKIRQRQIGSQTKGIITLIGELDFETQSMYTLTMYATDPYTEPGKDTRNIAGVNVVVIVQDVQDVPPIFTLAPPLTKINNTVKPGDVILRVHAEDGDKGVPREVTYGLISEGNPFTPFFNVSETTGEIILARPLEELTKITHVGAPIVLKIVAEEIRTSRDEPPAQATVVELGLLLGEPGNSPPYFENDNYMAWLDENAEPGTIVTFSDVYTTRVKDEDIGKAGVFALKLENNNGTFEISPAVAERSANFVITVRDNTLIDYEKFKSLRFKIVAQEVGPATNLSASVPVTIFLRDVNDNPPIFDVPVYEVTLSENASAGTRVVQVHATDLDSGAFGRIQYTKIIGDGSAAFEMNPDSGMITVSMGSILDREQTARLELTVEARDEDGRGMRGTATLIVNILDVNDNAPIFEKGIYEFFLNAELTNFTMPAFIKAVDADAEPPNNVVRYEIVHGNYDNKFQLHEVTGELTLRQAINKTRKVRQNNIVANVTINNKRKQFRVPSDAKTIRNETNATETSTILSKFKDFHLLNNLTESDLDPKNQDRRRRAEDNPLFVLTARAYDLGVPHLSNVAQIRIMRSSSAFARIVMFVMPGENPDPKKTAETLATITGSKVVIQEIKPYVSQKDSGSENGKRSVVVARVEQNGPGTLVDVDKIRASLAANGFGIISGMDTDISGTSTIHEQSDDSNSARSNSRNVSVIGSASEEVTVYKAENKLLTWLLVLLGLLLLAAIITLIVCCICPSCPFYMEPRKRRIHSSETLVIRSDGRPKRHIHRKPIKVIDGYGSECKEAWSAAPARQIWQFNRRNTKNLGIASLPGDILPGHQQLDIERMDRGAASLRNVPVNPTVFGEHVIHQTRIIPIPDVGNKVEDEQMMYMEDVEEQQHLSYEQAELDSLRRHELERGSDGVLKNESIAAAAARKVREQHFYRDGNAEVLRLVTRGEIEDRNRAKELYHANGKDILLQRFIEDQKLRRSQDLRDSFHESLHEADIDRSMVSHQRAMNETTEILILPERLEMQRQPSYNQRLDQQEQMLTADVQRLIVERTFKSKDEGVEDYRGVGGLRASMRDAEALETVAGDPESNVTYAIRDVELVKQNALLTRLLLEKEARGLNVPVVDSSSFLETQSLPGQVAIATQTDRTAATQTEFIARSRSDNEESEEDPRLRQKSKLKAGANRFETKEDFKKIKTIWVLPIPEENQMQGNSKKATPTRTRIEVKESHKISISPDAMKDTSNSLHSGDSDNDDGDVPQTKQRQVQAKLDNARKVVSKTINGSKKTKESRVEDTSTTPSPETKDKKTLLKGKIRKKIEKPPRKKLQKSIESEKSHFMEPSFRVLEREICSFQQKIRQFGDKKLKTLKKDEADKKDRESDDDDIATGYKKCEMTVTRTKSISRETSPSKNTVEQKTKTSEEESYTKVEKLTRPHQHTSSSDFEDSIKSKTHSVDHKERTAQSVNSKMQTRSRSQFRRQTHLEKSDTKSGTDNMDKSEDSKSKSDDRKESSSSVEAKTDLSPMREVGKCQTESEKKRGSMIQERKSSQNQKTRLKPAGIVNIKKRITSIKSKTSEDSMKKTSKREEKAVKSLTSDESRLTSPTKSRESLYHRKYEISEEDKSNGDDKSSMNKDSVVLNLDKFVKDAKGVDVKENSSITQTATDTLNINKSKDSVNEKKQESSKTSLKTQDIQKASVEMKGKNQSIDKRKHDVKSVEKDKISKSINDSDKNEKSKNQKEKSKSIESVMEKSDDAISFIVVSDHGKKHKDPMIDYKILEKHKDDHTNANEKLKPKELLDATASDSNISDISPKNELKRISQIIDNSIVALEKNIDYAKDAVSDKINETKQMSSELIDQSKQVLSDSIKKNGQSVSNKIDDLGNSITNEIHKVQQIETSFVNETSEAASDTFVATQQAVYGQIDETQKIVSDQINESNQTLADKINETEKDVHETIVDTKTNVKDMMDETKKNVKETIDESENIVRDKMNETKEGTTNLIIDSSFKTIKDFTTNLVDTAIDVSHNTVTTAREKVQELEDTLSSTDLLKLEITSLPDNIEDADKKNASEILNVINDSEMKEIKDVQSEERNKNQMTQETTSASNNAEIRDIIKESLNTEKILENKQCEEKHGTTNTESITTLSSSSQEKETRNERTQIKQTKQTPPEAPLNKEDSTSSCNANKGEEVTVAAAESSTAMTQLKQMEADALYPTDKKDPVAAHGNSDKTPETTTTQVSQEKQQGQIKRTTTLEIAPTDSENTDEVVTDENPESEKPKSTMKLSKKSIPTITTESTADEDDDTEDEDTSGASDVSRKTALRTEPYGTPRHSISSDGEDLIAGETSVCVKSDGKPRQKWSTSNRDLPLKLDASRQHEQSRETATRALFPQKIEVTPVDKPKNSGSKTTTLDQIKAPKSSAKESHQPVVHAETKAPESSSSKERPDPPRSRPMIVAVKKKELLRTDHFSRHMETRKISPRREKSDDTRPHHADGDTRMKSTTTTTSIRSRHLKLHVSHSHHQLKPGAVEVSSKDDQKKSETSKNSSPMMRDKEDQGIGSKIMDYGKSPEIINARSRYMAWYQQKRSEMEKKRREKKEAEDEQQKSKWLKKSSGRKSRKAKSAEDAKVDDEAKGSRSRERAKSSSEVTAQITTPQEGPRVHRLRIRPLVNVESEQLKAIVRQGRKLRREEGGTREEDPPVQIFAPEKPVQLELEDTLDATMHLEPRHHLTQHSEYKYEKTVIQPMPFYLHPPPPVPHSSPEHLLDDSSDSRRLDDDLDSGIAVSLQSAAGNTRLRHQQLLEKKSVFDIAYCEAAPTQLRSDSSTPPS